MSELPEELLSASLDDELSAEQQRAVSAELARSSRSRALLTELAAIRRTVRELPAPEPPDAFWARLAERVPAGRPRRGAVRATRGRMSVWLAGGAAAAAVVAALVVPGIREVNPRVRARVDAHAARTSESSDPVSALAPVAASVRAGR